MNVSGDIYDDLDEFEFNIKLNTINTEKDELLKENSELKAKFEKQSQENQKLREENEILKKNISKLYVTSRFSLNRKEKKLKALQAEIENLKFRRKNTKEQQLNKRRLESEENENFNPKRVKYDPNFNEPSSTGFDNENYEKNESKIDKPCTENASRGLKDNIQNQNKSKICELNDDVVSSQIENNSVRERNNEQKPYGFENIYQRRARENQKLLLSDNSHKISSNENSCDSNEKYFIDNKIIQDNSYQNKEDQKQESNKELFYSENYHKSLNYNENVHENYSEESSRYRNYHQTNRSYSPNYPNDRYSKHRNNYNKHYSRSKSRNHYYEQDDDSNDYQDKYDNSKRYNKYRDDYPDNRYPYDERSRNFRSHRRDRNFEENDWNTRKNHNNDYEFPIKGPRTPPPEEHKEVYSNEYKHSRYRNENAIETYGDYRRSKNFKQNSEFKERIEFNRRSRVDQYDDSRNSKSSRSRSKSVHSRSRSKRSRSRSKTPGEEWNDDHSKRSRSKTRSRFELDKNIDKEIKQSELEEFKSDVNKKKSETRKIDLNSYRKRKNEIHHDMENYTQKSIEDNVDENVQENQQTDIESNSQKDIKSTQNSSSSEYNFGKNTFVNEKTNDLNSENVLKEKDIIKIIYDDSDFVEIIESVKNKIDESSHSTKNRPSSEKQETVSGDFISEKRSNENHSERKLAEKGNAQSSENVVLQSVVKDNDNKQKERFENTDSCIETVDLSNLESLKIISIVNIPSEKMDITNKCIENKKIFEEMERDKITVNPDSLINETNNILEKNQIISDIIDMTMDAEAVNNTKENNHISEIIDLDGNTDDEISISDSSDSMKKVTSLDIIKEQNIKEIQENDQKMKNNTCSFDAIESHEKLNIVKDRNEKTDANRKKNEKKIIQHKSRKSPKKSIENITCELRNKQKLTEIESSLKKNNTKKNQSNDTKNDSINDKNQIPENITVKSASSNNPETENTISIQQSNTNESAIFAVISQKSYIIDSEKSQENKNSNNDSMLKPDTKRSVEEDSALILNLKESSQKDSTLTLDNKGNGWEVSTSIPDTQGSNQEDSTLLSDTKESSQSIENKKISPVKDDLDRFMSKLFEASPIKQSNDKSTSNNMKNKYKESSSEKYIPEGLLTVTKPGSEQGKKQSSKHQTSKCKKNIAKQINKDKHKSSSEVKEISRNIIVKDKHNSSSKDNKVLENIVINTKEIQKQEIMSKTLQKDSSDVNKIILKSSIKKRDSSSVQDKKVVIKSTAKTKDAREKKLSANSCKTLNKRVDSKSSNSKKKSEPFIEGNKSSVKDKQFLKNTTFLLKDNQEEKTHENREQTNVSSDEVNKSSIIITNTEENIETILERIPSNSIEKREEATVSSNKVNQLSEITNINEKIETIVERLPSNSTDKCQETYVSSNEISQPSEITNLKENIQIIVDRIPSNSTANMQETNVSSDKICQPSKIANTKNNIETIVETNQPSLKIPTDDEFTFLIDASISVMNEPVSSNKQEPRRKSFDENVEILKNNLINELEKVNNNSNISGANQSTSSINSDVNNTENLNNSKNLNNSRNVNNTEAVNSSNNVNNSENLNNSNNIDNNAKNLNNSDNVNNKSNSNNISGHHELIPLRNKHSVYSREVINENKIRIVVKRNRRR